MFSVVPCTKIETTTQKNSNSKIWSFLTRARRSNFVKVSTIKK
jgi:hypothetical protein